jgi:hypothetical protein
MTPVMGVVVVEDDEVIRGWMVLSWKDGLKPLCSGGWPGSHRTGDAARSIEKRSAAPSNDAPGPKAG